MDLYEQIKTGLLWIHKRSPAEWRFWQRVDKNGPVHPVYGQCWMWTGLRKGIWHGFFMVSRQVIYVHRFSHELHVGPIPSGMCVLHRCDNPPCVNPAHLFLGTRVDNNLDREEKGRGGDHKGRRNGRAKLTEDQVREVRERYCCPCPGHGNATALAREFGVTPSAIHFIGKGQHWRHVKT